MYVVADIGMPFIVEGKWDEEMEEYEMEEREAVNKEKERGKWL